MFALLAPLAYRRVMRGVERLDKEMPGWALFVNTYKLDLGDGRWCVLGQLFSGHYNMGEAVLFGQGRSSVEAERAAVRHGFMCGFLSNNFALTNEWIRVIELRKYESESLEVACPAKAAAPAV